MTDLEALEHMLRRAELDFEKIQWPETGLFLIRIDEKLFQSCFYFDHNDMLDDHIIVQKCREKMK